MSTRIATQRKPQRRADFIHARGSELRNPSAQSLLRNRNCIVQVHGAGRFHAIFIVQNYLGRHAPDGRCNRRDRHGGQIRNGTGPRKHNDGSLLVGRSKLIKPDISSAYSCGHAASASHSGRSSRVFGCLIYPSRSRSSLARSSNRRRCSRNASRTRAERFFFVRRAA